jgi:hypothetical protein
MSPDVCRSYWSRRRWTGIEPAGRGSPVPTALKAAEPTRCPDTSLCAPDPVRERARSSTAVRAPMALGVTTFGPMKKVLLLLALLALLAVGARQLSSST